MALEIAFAEKSLRLICENMAIAERKLGEKVAEKLKRRLADLRAASYVKEIVAGKPRVLDGKHPEQIAVELCDEYLLIFCANHNTNPKLDSGEIDWSQVNRIKILLIESHYE